MAVSQDFIKCFWKKEMYTFTQQGCIELTKCHSKYVYNVTKDFYFK